MNKKRIKRYLFRKDIVKNPQIVDRFLNDYAETVYGTEVAKIDDYLYRTTFKTWDYKSAEQFMKNHELDLGACSSVRAGNFYGRNYDWYYNNRVTFQVVCDNDRNTIHKSIGISGGTSALTEGEFDPTQWNDAYEMIPFMMLDGINDAGVISSINVVPTGDYGITTGTAPDKPFLSAIMMVRYILDYAGDADEAVELLRGRNIVAPKGLEIHCMVADSTKTLVIEFINNEMVVSEDTAMTNFYIHDFDGTKASLTPFGSGFERYNTLKAGADDVSTAADMLELMEDAYFTNGYKMNTNPLWYTDFVGQWSDGTIITTRTPEVDVISIMEKAKWEYEHRTRNGKTWQTVHSCAYDMANKKLYYHVQEDPETTYELELGE